MPKARVVVLGAGFGGLELCTTLAETLGDAVDVTMIDKADSFMFGFSKLDVMFGHAEADAVRMPYRHFAKKGVRLLQETVTAIDPDARRVTTNAGVHEADILVIALGADYDYAATPGLAESTEFYSIAGAEKLRGILPSFVRGHALVGVCGAPYKCPPAPSECCLMLHDYLTERGVRKDCTITLVLPLPSPVPPSPGTSAALIQAFKERDITFMPLRRMTAVEKNVAVLDDGTRMPFDLMLGVPKNRAPDVVVASGMTVDGWVPIDVPTLETKHPGVYAIGDIAATGTPKAGVFAEDAARAVAKSIIAKVRGGDGGRYTGAGSCYIEFGGGRVARVDVDFLSGPAPTGAFNEPTVELFQEKVKFGASRRARWFGL